jgi:ATPase subunit of ABC transporter with duplicated ATPase domains
MPSIQLSQVSFAFPGSETILDEINFSIGSGIAALAGPNGAGKTTLMRLMLRLLQSQRGNVIWHGFHECGWLPQSLMPATRSSGEEKMRRLSALLRDGDGIVFLDEPETHLDYKNREWLRKALARHRGLIVIASHDPTLLDDAGVILHTEMRQVSVYRMSYAAYQAEIENKKANQVAKIGHAEHELKKAERARRADFERQLKRSRNAAARAPLAGIPRIARGLMKRNAEQTLGKIIRRNQRQNDADHAALENLRAEKTSRAEFSFTALHPPLERAPYLEVNGLQLYRPDGAALWRRPVSFSAKPGEALHIAGANGSGKSMLLKTLLSQGEFQRTGNIALGAGEIRLMDSAYSGIAAGAQVLEITMQAGINDDTGETRRLLGAYGFPGDAVFRTFQSLSAGEKIRLRLFLMSHAPEPVAGFFSDEAETGLDTETRRLYTGFLNTFPGLVLVVSHDAAFVKSLDIRNRVVLDMSPVME